VPFAFITGVVIGGVVFLVEHRKKTMVCPKCGAAKYADKSQDCSCGGTFEEIGKLKWIEEFPDSSDENNMSDPPPQCSYAERIKFYSLADIDNVKQGIDKRRFPDRYQLVIQEIEKRMNK